MRKVSRDYIGKKSGKFAYSRVLTPYIALKEVIFSPVPHTLTLQSAKVALSDITLKMITLLSNGVAGGTG